ncbi:MAG: hypothetical protein SFU27_06985 [Thermonemataceae bacterium]|nr:hypothetical protein [Thermonemataceae bacterium]
MKKIFLLLSFAVMVSFVGFAQKVQQRNMPTPEQRAANITEKMNKKANFTPEQKNQVYAINLDVAQRLQAVNQNLKSKRIDNVAAAEQRKNLNKERESRIVAILTPEQKAKYSSAKARKTNTQQNGKIAGKQQFQVKK